MKMKIKMEQSPFYVERDETTKAKTRKSLYTNISPEINKEIQKYIKQRDDDFNTSKFVKMLVMDFLNNHAFEQDYFRNLNLILLIPKNASPDECRVIGVIQHEDIVTNIFHGGGLNYPLTHNFIYTLKEFNQKNYEQFIHYFKGIYEFDENIFFNIDKTIQEDFAKVRECLSSFYPDINIDDSYFVMCNLNNYLDVLFNGVYRSIPSEFEHEGVIVLLHGHYEGLFARIRWSHIHNEFSFSLYFNDLDKFDSTIAPFLNEDLLDDYNSITEYVKALSGKKNILKYKRDLTLKEDNYMLEKIKENKLKRKSIDEELSQL